MANKSKKKGYKTKIILIVFFLIILCSVSVYYFLFQSNFNILTIKEFIHKLPKDKEAPNIVVDNITIIEGDNVDLKGKASVSDNIDTDVKLEVSGDYNVNKVGVYDITYTATDFSNNSTSKNITLTVKAKVKKTPENPQIERIDFTTSKGFKGYTENGITYIDGILIVNKTYYLPSTYGNGLTNDTQNAFEQMKAAALTEGISLWVCSGFRSYKTQKNLYNSYVNRDGKEKADTYSARAGYSEHQSGLAIDINYASSSFNGTPTAIWLSQNAYKFGFILRYPDGKTNETGYKFESWHYRYVGIDLATKLYNDGNWITIEDYFGIDSKYSD